MNVEIEGSVDYYLAHAAHIRAAADRANLTDVRSELLKIAAAFERLAEHARQNARRGR